MSQFNTVGVIGKHRYGEVEEVTTAVLAYLEGAGKKILLDRQSMQQYAAGLPHVARNDLALQADLVIVLGGDGTILGAARSLAMHGTPMLGVNLGRLGFLADVSPENISAQLDAVFAGEYSSDRRFLLQADIYRQGELMGSNVALNDVVVHTGDVLRMLDFETSIDGQPIRRHSADGVVVSTPTGSTAYALSCGGPVMHPELEAMLLVPICSHALTDRPLVISTKSKVAIRVFQSRSQVPAVVSWDGQRHIDLDQDDQVVVSRTDYSAQFIHPPGYDYFERLRSKLNWF